MKLHVKSASFSTDNGHTSRFSFSYRIFNNKNFFQNISTVLEEKSSCERFCKVPRAENHCWSKIGNGGHFVAINDNSDVITALMMTNCHLNTTVIAIFPNVCLQRRSLCSDLVLTLENCIEPPSYARTAYVVVMWPSFLFDSFVKIWVTWKTFLGKWFTAPPGKKISLTPMPFGAAHTYMAFHFSN